MRRLLILFSALLLCTTACDGLVYHLPSPHNLDGPSPADDCSLRADSSAYPFTFCDTFDEPAPGGRNGDLTDDMWTVQRLSQNNNPGQGTVNNYAPATNAQICMDSGTVSVGNQPGDTDNPNDFYVCGRTAHADPPEPNHFMEAMSDNGNYVAQGARSTQRVNFADGATVVFDVDAKTEGTHSAWPEVWLTADPDQLPHDDFPGTHIFPREGVMINFGGDWCSNWPSNGSFPPGEPPAGSVKLINEYHNYVETVHSFNFSNSQCYTTHSDMANHFEIKLSTTHIEVWATDDDGTNFRRVAQQNVSLPFTQGYLSFQHAQYNACKHDLQIDMCNTTYHWHAIGWTGGLEYRDPSFQIPDALDPQSDGTFNLGYQTPTSTFPVGPIDLLQIGAAYLTYNVYWFGSPRTLDTVINGTHRSVAGDPDAQGYQWSKITQPVDLGDLVSGMTNFVTINNTGCSDQCPTVANIDLELVPG